MLTCHLTETIVRRHHDPVFSEEHIAAWSAEKSVPPGQQADPHDGQIRRTTAVFERIRARRPLGPDNFHGANLRFDRITGADLHDSKETNRQSGVDWHHNASTLDGYLISRHIQPSDDEVAGARGNVDREPRRTLFAASTARHHRPFTSRLLDCDGLTPEAENTTDEPSLQLYASIRPHANARARSRKRLPRDPVTRDGARNARRAVRPGEST